MRLLFTALACLISVSVVGQEVGLQIKNGQILYQQIFQGEIKSPEVFLEDMVGTSDVRIIENYTAYAELLIPNADIHKSINELGKKPFNTAIFIGQSSIKAKIKLEIQEGRYRVSITDIVLVFPEGYPHYGESSHLKEYIIKNNSKIRVRSFDEAKLIYDKLFNGLIVSEKAQEKEDTW